MCTAITYTAKDHYFGRTLDLEYSYREAVTVTPRNFPLHFRKLPTLSVHHAIIGMATVAENYPLYYEATNEYGLSMAGLNFPANAVYFPAREGRDNVTPFECIPWILGQCKNLGEARMLLERMYLLDLPFSDKFPLSPLHWILADRESAITVESVADGLRIYENPIGVLTNNPTFDYHMTHLCDYMQLTNLPPVNALADGIDLVPYSRGMGAIGLPGDLSSASRFVRAAFVKLHALAGESEEETVSQFFHMLGAVEQQYGCARTPEGKYVRTVYTSCLNAARGIYYYTTYENSRISAVDMHREDLAADTLITYPLIKEPQILLQN